MAGNVLSGRLRLGFGVQGLRVPDGIGRLLKNRLAVVGVVIIATLVIVAVFAPWIAPYDPNAQDCATGALKGPGGGHLLGTDATCRDVLSRLIYGARISLAVGVLSQVVILLIALPIGVAAAMGGRGVDNLMMRFTDMVFAFPDLLAIILLREALRGVSVPGGDVTVLIFAISIVGWVTVARVVRAQMLSYKEREFVLAARAMGASNFQIFRTHLLPNAMGPVIVVLTFGVPLAIFAESALSFIGIGVAPPTATWGRMVDTGYQSIFAVPMLAVYPAIAISLTMMAFTFLGDGLRDALDPRGR